MINSNSQRIGEMMHIDEFASLLSQAEGSASTEFEIEFVSNISDKFAQYGENMFLSEKQRTILESISDR